MKNSTKLHFWSVVKYHKNKPPIVYFLQLLISWYMLGSNFFVHNIFRKQSIFFITARLAWNLTNFTRELNRQEFYFFLTNSWDDVVFVDLHLRRNCRVLLYHIWIPSFKVEQQFWTSHIIFHRENKKCIIPFFFLKQKDNYGDQSLKFL